MPIDIDRAGVQRLQAQSGAQVVEVLPRDEYEREHIVGALSLPLGELRPERAEQALDRQRPVIVYCEDAT